MKINYIGAGIILPKIHKMKESYNLETDSYTPVLHTMDLEDIGIDLNVFDRRYINDSIYLLDKINGTSKMDFEYKFKNSILKLREFYKKFGKEIKIIKINLKKYE